MKHHFLSLLITYFFLHNSSHYCYASNLDSIFKKENHSIKLDLRVDFDANMNSYEESRASFWFNSLQLVLEGEFSPKFAYFIKQRLNSLGEVSKDNLLAATDFAMIIYRPNKNWLFDIGKQVVQLGTFEYDYNTTELYFFSQPNNIIQAYETGIRAAYLINNHEFNLQITNAGAPQFSVPGYKYSFNYAAVWAASFYNDLLKTRYGYMLTNIGKGMTTRWLTAGNQLNIRKATIELDYMNGTYFQPDYSPEEKLYLANDQTVILSYKQKFTKKNSWAFGLKGIWDKRTNQDINRTIYNKYTATAHIEYFPLKKNNFNIHIAYAYCRTNYNKEVVERTTNHQNHIITGARWLFTLL